MISPSQNEGSPALSRYYCKNGRHCTPAEENSVRDSFRESRSLKRITVNRGFLASHSFWFNDNGQFIGVYEEEALMKEAA